MHFGTGSKIKEKYKTLCQKTDKWFTALNYKTVSSTRKG
jgi:hypothetical protein